MNIADASKIPSIAKTPRRWTSVLKGDGKARKARSERRRAKRNPECIPAYGRYRGYW